MRALKRLLRVAETLDAEVIVLQGVETQDDLDACKDIGVKYAQGYVLVNLRKYYKEPPTYSYFFSVRPQSLFYLPLPEPYSLSPCNYIFPLPVSPIWRVPF